jgi:hypothetical protein
MSDLQEVKFGVKAVVNGSVSNYHFTMLTKNRFTRLALKSYCTYVDTETEKWINPGRDYVFETQEQCTAMFNVLMLSEADGQIPPPRMQFWSKIMNQVEK